MTTRIAIAAILLATASASADTMIQPACVALDTSRDDLTIEGAHTALLTLVRVLEHEDVLVVETGCDVTYTLSHRRIAPGKLVVSLRGPHATRRYTGATSETMVAVYHKLATTVLAAERRAVAERAPVPAVVLPPTLPPHLPAQLPGHLADDTDDAPARPVELVDSVPSSMTLAAGRRLFYMRVGAGGVVSGEGAATAWAFGWRIPSGRLVYDIGVGGVGGGGAGTGGLKAAVYRLKDPNGETSSYLGGGLSITGATTTRDGMEVSGGGMQLDAAVGIELKRSDRRMRVFLQADLGLPLFAIGDVYPASFGLSVGAGF